ncbi:MAG TPA: hypothetical protein VGG69_04500 [Rhizomicrobium sp.]
MKYSNMIVGACAAAALTTSADAVTLKSSPLTLRASNGQWAHIFPAVKLWKQLRMDRHPPGTAHPPGTVRPPGTNGPSYLIYNGGPVMTSYLNFYIIFWVPSTLQSGNATSMSAGYRQVVSDMVANYGGKGISANNSQYYQSTGGRRPAYTFITGQGGLVDTAVATDPYPKVRGGCTDSYATIGKNCFTDAQLQTEIQKVMSAKGWTGGMNKLFLVFTSSGEGSCFDATSASCAYTQYCAYHSHITGKNGAPNVIYANEPFGNPATCQTDQAGTPNAALDPNADAAASPASHEMSEAITDPLGNAWWDSNSDTYSGEEIGDICAYQYIFSYLDGGAANQLWGGRYFELQSEYDNSDDYCALAGPAGFAVGPL